MKGDSFKTWTTKTNKFWLKDTDLLPVNLPNSRVLTYKYNASVSAWFGASSSDTILQHAHTLIAELTADREVNQKLQLVMTLELTTFVA